jgi:hypothetical protein
MPDAERVVLVTDASANRRLTFAPSVLNTSSGRNVASPTIEDEGDRHRVVDAYRHHVDAVRFLELDALSRSWMPSQHHQGNPHDQVLHR